MRRLLSIAIYSLFCLLSCHGLALDGLSNQKPLSVDQAFVVSIEQDNQEVEIIWDIYPGHYLYADKIRLETKNAKLEPYTLPIGESHIDHIYGQTQILTNTVKLKVHVESLQPDAKLMIYYQGCSNRGFCYPPTIKMFELTAANPVNELFSPLIALLLGIGIAFTPCVLPLYPLITTIIVGQHKRAPLAVLALSMFYIQGMALAYTLLGVLVAKLGIYFHLFLQSPTVLWVMSGIFILLACSMFGLYTLQLPSVWQTKINLWSNQQKRGVWLGVFVMGILAGLVSTPCTTAPLSAILLYIAQSGSMLTGGLSLYFYAIGMGLPLVLIALFGNKVMPKSGRWLNYVKQLFGFLILSLPIILLERLYGEQLAFYLWLMLVLAMLIWLLVICWNRGRIVRILLFSCLSLPIYFSYQPQFFRSYTTSGLMFSEITSTQDLVDKLTDPKHQLVMLDFYADWCVSCKAFNQDVLTNPEVQRLLNQVDLLILDASQESDDKTALLNHLSVLGLPTIVFFDQSGHEIKPARITGTVTTEQFIEHLTRLLEQRQ